MVVISRPSYAAASGEAGIDAPAVHEHRARAALAVVAALLGAREVQVLAQRVEQRHARVEHQLVHAPIHAQAHRDRRSGPRSRGRDRHGGGTAGIGGERGGDGAGVDQEAAAGEARGIAGRGFQGRGRAWGECDSTTLASFVPAPGHGAARHNNAADRHAMPERITESATFTWADRPRRSAPSGRRALPASPGGRRSPRRRSGAGPPRGRSR